MTLLGKVVEKILGHKQFGQDLLMTGDFSTEEARERIRYVLFVARVVRWVICCSCTVRACCC